MPLLRKALVMRWVAVPACLVWGVWELYALQRAHWKLWNFEGRIGALGKLNKREQL